MHFGFYTYIIELIHVFQILHVYFRTYTGLTDLIRVLVNLYLFYRYESTRRYYRDFTCTKAPAGTTEQIQRYP